MAAIYEIRVKPGGAITSTLLREDVNQAQACEQVVGLMNSLGRVTSHDERCPEPAPVNQGLFMPGAASGK